MREFRRWVNRPGEARERAGERALNRRREPRFAHAVTSAGVAEKHLLRPLPCFSHTRGRHTVPRIDLAGDLVNAVLNEL
jgi:hypothetical protein